MRWPEIVAKAVAEPAGYAIASVGWICGEYVWFIDSAWGTVDELVGWAAAMIDSAGCVSD